MVKPVLPLMNVAVGQLTSIRHSVGSWPRGLPAKRRMPHDELGLIVMGHGFADILHHPSTAAPDLLAFPMS